MNMYFVYILKSQKTGSYYAGYTTNLERILMEHNSGKTASLVKHIPLEIIRIEEYPLYEDARRRERQIKQYKSGDAFKKLLNL